ncbi:MAG: hypothetical protein COU47_01570 [Candidatus Niyogibacteria bacterium CG10_big_fil_rev_8_21_14_0_10_46_36]|uniref:Uncharacterized protein n=1 Tax=Candidatus Niyogibacteria bacterium CG10_big_fil_rev_8_21_14_0_10_46_36 TaxID=1974726 RepID=A0A2H0TDY4_9BACT|nr:MAG: hypothetical protein COU47_01570 [Candidatus Niyogibacteria bacterium CG10_big_fil_rev_8_21_14_0_10_46_36]
MAWWTHILFAQREKDSSSRRKGGFFNTGYSKFKKYIKKKSIDILYILFSIFTYLYLAVSVFTFFFHTFVPDSLPFAIEALSDPYLGALGIYIVIHGIEKKRRKTKSKGQLFVPLWTLFFIIASVFLYFVPDQTLDTLYKTVVTNAFAAIILRVGMLLRYL